MAISRFLVLGLSVLVVMATGGAGADLTGFGLVLTEDEAGSACALSPDVEVLREGLGAGAGATDFSVSGRVVASATVGALAAGLGGISGLGFTAAAF